MSARTVGRTRIVAEPRWSPDGNRLGWIESFAGRADLVVTPAWTKDGPAPALSVTPDLAVTGVGAYGGGAWCFGSDSEVVYAAADGRLAAVAADGGPHRVLTRTDRAFAPAAHGGGGVFGVGQRGAFPNGGPGPHGSTLAPPPP